MEEKREAGGRSKGTLKNRVKLSEQDIYAAGDSIGKVEAKNDG